MMSLVDAVWVWLGIDKARLRVFITYIKAQGDCADPCVLGLDGELSVVH